MVEKKEQWNSIPARKQASTDVPESKAQTEREEFSKSKIAQMAGQWWPADIQTHCLFYLQLSLVSEAQERNKNTMCNVLCAHWPASELCDSA